MKLHLAQVGPLPPKNATPRCPDAPRLRSHAYTSAAPGAPHDYLLAVAGPPPGSGDFRRRMTAAGDVLRAHGVGAIFLVGSSFAAHDTRQILMALARRWPEGAALVRQLAAQIVGDHSHDAGNYTLAFAQLLEHSLRRGNDEIQVRLVHWSGEHHHLGRADAAVRLIDELAALELPPETRAMIWGHGQAGNVLALLAGLLSTDAAMRDRFFAAAQIHYRLPATGIIDIPVWHRVRQLLRRDGDGLSQRPLDLVTFGTPLRYAWSHRAADNLLHFIHHRPAGDGQPHLAPLPRRIDELRSAASGDYVQQLAVAGTDGAPSRFAWRSWLADRRLGALFDAEVNHATVGERLACGMRVPDAGTTLLVDYGPPSGPVCEHLAGHAVYTRRDWLMFHAEQIAQRLAGHASSSARAA